MELRRFGSTATTSPFKSTIQPGRAPKSEFLYGYDHTSGVWQFEGNFLVPQGTSGATIMQIFGSPKQATTLQLAVYNGDLKYYRDNLLAANIYNKWVRLNVIHNVSARTVTIFINGERKLSLFVVCCFVFLAKFP
ncbi:unnamed protein product [Malus baccata var. baccata]